jgi:TIR domain-containing protein
VQLEYLYALEHGKRVVPVLLDDTPLPSRLAVFHGVDLRRVIPHRSGQTAWERVTGATRVSPELTRSHQERVVQEFASQFYSCFISYASTDQEFAQQLYDDLSEHGIQCWFAPHDILGGRTILEQVARAITDHDRMLLILSDASLNSSWVRTEIEYAREKERSSGKVVLFPIALASYETVKKWTQFNPDIGDDNARRIREFYIPDFSNWHDRLAYDRSLGRLIRALQTDTHDGPRAPS